MEVQSLTSIVLEYLRKCIITGELQPGQKLNENELASQLDISRHPLREAFRVLENEHLVVSIPRKGTYVTDLSTDDLLEVYQSREMIECYTIDLLKAKNIRDLPQVDLALEAAHGLSIPSNDDPDQFLAFHKELANFHFKLIEAAGNSRLVHFYQAIFFNLARYQFRFLHIPGTLKTSLKEHGEVLDAIKTGDYERAKENLRHHIKKRIQGQLRALFQ